MPPRPRNNRQNRKKEPEFPIDEEFKNMDSQALKSNLQNFREKMNDLKSKRNYLQMDRDMVQSFFENTQKEQENFKISLINKEAEAQKLEEEHQMEIRVFLHKVKQLEYEQEKTNKEIENDGTNQKVNEDSNFHGRLKEMSKEKEKLKMNYGENEKTNITKVY